LYDFCATKSIEEIETDLNFNKWLETYADKLINMFIHFAMTHHFGGTFAVCSAYKFHPKEVFDEQLVDQTIAEIKSQILSLASESEYLQKFQELTDRWKSNISTLMTIVSGKDYLLPILLLKAKSIRSNRPSPSTSDLKFLLVQHCELDRLASLKAAIEG